MWVSFLSSLNEVVFCEAVKLILVRSKRETIFTYFDIYHTSIIYFMYEVCSQIKKWLIKCLNLSKESLFLCNWKMKTLCSLLISWIIYCIIGRTHGKVMWINLSLACQNVCELQAELAELPSAYLLVSPGGRGVPSRLFYPEEEEEGTSGVRPPVSGDSSQPTFLFSCEGRTVSSLPLFRGHLHLSISVHISVHLSGQFKAHVVITGQV